jgi:tRNA(Ile)-lysidine synthase
MSGRVRLAALELLVLRTVRKFDMLPRGEHVLVAVSGGADSVALLLCLRDLASLLDLKLTVAHLNHQLRGAAADEDQEFVRRLSADLDLPLITDAVDVRARAIAGRENLESCARTARYDFLRASAGAAGAGRIATGHSLNDQAETIFLRLLRGCGPGGLEGIQPVREGRIIRPLIECSRARILEFLAERKAAWREDTTNRDMRLRRNRIRHELIPYLEQHFNPRLIAALTREAGLAHAAHGFLEEHAHAAWRRLRQTVPGGVALPAAGLIELHPALRPAVARLALEEALGSLQGIGSVHIRQILRLCAPRQSGRRIMLPGGAAACRNPDLLELSRQGPAAAPRFEYSLAWPGSRTVPEVQMQFIASIHLAAEADRGTPTCAFLDPDALPPVLTIRPRRPGDRYGGKGHRKLKKLLQNARMPAALRAGLPLVADGDTVIWAPGLPPAKTYRAGSGCGRCVRLEVRPMEDGDALRRSVGVPPALSK